jgi:hypothetical protein
MSQILESPAAVARTLWETNPTNDELPKLRYLTDVLWGYWNRDNPNFKNINWYIVQQVENVDTAKIIARALKNKKKTLAPWPGTTFSMDSDEGHAILGKLGESPLSIAGDTFTMYKQPYLSTSRPA